ncbi:hypothetical protein FZEAL_8942 [Fusarium zealandicum]|uniref:Diphthine--ammonia ligase n=1 Tax=Fusarium zealandicum TaxID=1053134 RepID=A0A8H4UDC3_9HYPO|nr:hypothetical protein FZEAL_8942 [Fusarium zealandicum]
MSSNSLNVIALISGGKDSFFSLIHCIEHGHRIVALANLFPGAGSSSPAATSTSEEALQTPGGVELIDPGTRASDHRQGAHADGEPSDRDLNSFMYQTVGHEVLPLYAAATGLPLYRLPIAGRAVRHERDYDVTADAQGSDETESMLPLLQAIIARHPEANALCAGAILSTYQRTRVESIALRLGLVPLAYLWQYPILPPPTTTVTSNDTQLLIDMANAGLEARIIKVASAGLDEDHLWERVSSEAGARRVKSALRKFGSTKGAAALGEGGEFETMVVDGPASLFKSRISIPEHGRKIVREGGGCSWLMLGGARLEEKSDPAQQPTIRVPDMLDPKFQAVFDELSAPLTQETTQASPGVGHVTSVTRGVWSAVADVDLRRWSVLPDPSTGEGSIHEETIQVVDKIRSLVLEAGIEPSQISNIIVVLRRMSDFPQVNGEYGKLFPKPNPPSRVTISCGDLLPAGANIAVYLTAPLSQATDGRNGLHVQSRSYWAPANIGPYSQAIDVPITVLRQATGLRCISIAGQIPLIPATMLLPPPSDTSHELQIVLSLQHLWRVGQELKVQWWTSSVAYFPRAGSSQEMQRSAQLAGRAWKQAHGAPHEEEETEDGPDLWDLKYNPAYMSLGATDEKAVRRSIPDWDALTLRQQNEPETCVPPMFAVEVEELPRQSAVEWHAHNGLSRVEDTSLEMFSLPEDGSPDWKAWHTIVKTATATLIYSAVSHTRDDDSKLPFEALETGMHSTLRSSLWQIQRGELEDFHVKPSLVYVDVEQAESFWDNARDASTGYAIIPCRSIWSPDGQKMAILGLFETVLTHGP